MLGLDMLSLHHPTKGNSGSSRGPRLRDGRMVCPTQSPPHEFRNSLLRARLTTGAAPSPHEAQTRRFAGAPAARLFLIAVQPLRIAKAVLTHSQKASSSRETGALDETCSKNRLSHTESVATKPQVTVHFLHVN